MSRFFWYHKGDIKGPQVGPYERFALWVQGCPFRCLSCMTPGSLPLEGGDEISVTDLTQEVLVTPGIGGYNGSLKFLAYAHHTPMVLDAEAVRITRHGDDHLVGNQRSTGCHALFLVGLGVKQGIEGDGKACGATHDPFYQRKTTKSTYEHSVVDLLPGTP